MATPIPSQPDAGSMPERLGTIRATLDELWLRLSLLPATLTLTILAFMREGGRA